MDGEKAWHQLHKNTVSNIEQVLEATLHKVAAIRPCTTHHENYKVRQTKHAGQCWRSREELISDVLLWTPSHGRAKSGQPARTNLQQRCGDMECSPEDLPEAMNDREGWWERVRGIHAGGTTRWSWWFYWTLSIHLHTIKCFQVLLCHHYYHVIPQAWISLNLSHHLSLLSITPGRSSRLHPVLAWSCCI